MALDGDKHRALGMVGQLATDHPRLPILTVSSDSQALLQSLQRGAKHFLTQPVTLEDLVGALRRSLSETGTERPTGPAGRQAPQGGRPDHQRPRVPRRGRVYEHRGQPGRHPGRHPDNQVALIDLDLAMGDADIAIELPGNDNLSMGDLARNIERLDMNYLKRALVKHPETGLSVLRHPLEIHEIGGIHEGHVERILNLLKISYTHLILDLSKALLPTDLMALRMSHLILLIAQLELSSLRNVVRLIHSLSPEGDLGDKLRVVVNRAGSEIAGGRDHGQEGRGGDRQADLLADPERGQGR